MMRFQLGVGFLLVVLLGAACTSPIRAHYYNNNDASAEEPQASGEEGGALVESSPDKTSAQQQPPPEAMVPESSGVATGSLDTASSGGLAYEPAAKDEASAVEPTAVAEPIEGANEKRQEGSQPAFGLPSDPSSAGSNQEQMQAQQQQQPQQQLMSPPANQPIGASPQLQTQQQDSSSSQQATDQVGPSTGPVAQDGSQQQQASSGRGLSDFLGAMMNPNMINNQQQIPFSSQTPQQQRIEQQPQQIQQQHIQMLPQQQQVNSVKQAQHPSHIAEVPRENLPTIIENNQKQAPTQQQQQAQQQQQHQQQQQATALVLPSVPPTEQQLNGGNSSLAPSTSRTFGEGWTNCQGGSSGKYGTCKNDVNCKKDKGIPDGTCMSGLGVCCVMALTCNDKSFENNTFFANPDFPEPSWEARLCEVEIKKKHSKIIQIMIEFEEFELAPPNHEGECITDVFQIKLGSGRPSPYSLLRMCGQNTGQHMYLDVSQIDEPLLLSVATSGGGYPRRWSIRIVQMDEKNYLLAPPGCLQYYTDTIGHFRSFNLGQNLRNLYYAICFRIDNGYSGIRFTSNFFGMNGQHCRKQKPHGIGGPPAIGYNRPQHGNATYEAHPHHLVIPPPGYAMPPPRPKHQLPGPPPPPPAHAPIRPPQQQQQYGVNGYQLAGDQPPPPPQQHYPGNQKLRVKRLAYAEMPEMRYPRTLHEHEKDKEVPKHHEHHEHHLPPPPPSYGGQSYGGQSYGGQSYGGQSYGPQSYGPPSQGGYASGYGPPPAYGHGQHHYQHEEVGKKGEWKDGKWEEKKDDKWFWQDNKWGWKTDKKDEKFGEVDKYGYKEDKFGAGGWKGEKKDEKYGSYGPQAGGQPHHQHSHHHHGGPPGYYGAQSGGYNTGGYGNEGSYGGEYHHKEIDKFGKKYEHLEYKHEKNHLDKEGKKDEKWWSFWNKKDDKKDKKDKEKFFQHHEALFPMMHIPEMPHCEPRFCGANDVITFPPSGDSISEMCGNRFNRGRGPKIISGSPLVVYVSNRGHNRGAGFDLNYEQVFYVPRPYTKK